jgi:two-component system chemotaxis response regulator CheB
MDNGDNTPVVVIGASAGGTQALFKLVGELPADFPFPIFVVVHIGRVRSELPSLLKRSGRLPATHGTNGERFRSGHIYVAPPDRHMLIRDDVIHLSHGPRENHSRPAIDPLFRSAATARGTGAIGIILSGALHDGAVGMAMIKAHGGTTIVQDPDDAEIEGMPESALRMVQVDYTLPAVGIGRFLASPELRPGKLWETSLMTNEIHDDQEMIQRDFAEQETDQRDGQLTMFTCPDCGGTLWQSATGPIIHFRCHVGHTWGPETLLGNKSEELEAALWSSVRLLEERATLTRQVAKRVSRTSTDQYRIGGLQEQADLDEHRADTIRKLLNSPLDAALEMIYYPAARSDSDA